MAVGRTGEVTKEPKLLLTHMAVHATSLVVVAVVWMVLISVHGVQAIPKPMYVPVTGI